jgi:hypothetical protein
MPSSSRAHSSACASSLTVAAPALSGPARRTRPSGALTEKVPRTQRATAVPVDSIGITSPVPNLTVQCRVFAFATGVEVQ